MHDVFRVQLYFCHLVKCSNKLYVRFTRTFSHPSTIVIILHHRITSFDATQQYKSYKEESVNKEPEIFLIVAALDYVYKHIHMKHLIFLLSFYVRVFLGVSWFHLSSMHYCLTTTILLPLEKL